MWALLTIFALLAVNSAAQKSATFDETSHLAAGVSYVQHRDFRMNAEHPVFAKSLAGLAASWAGAEAKTDSEAWATKEQWDFGREVIYESSGDWRRILAAGRLPMIGLGVLLGFLLWSWTRAMYGPASAAVALALYAFSPTFLAHTRLVTTDVPLTLGVVAAVAALWRAWHTGRAIWVVAAAGAVALTMITKFSAFSYGPVYVVLCLLPSARRPWGAGVRHLALFLGAAFVLTELAVFVAYGFAWDWTTMRSLGLEARGVTAETMSLARRIPLEIMATIPWPSEDFARGMKDILFFTEAGHPVYLLGKASDTGTWWSPFLTLGVKASLPLLLMAVVGLAVSLRRPAWRTRELLFLGLPALLVLGTNVAANLGLGVRHLLPMFPFLILLAVAPLRGGGWPLGAWPFFGVTAMLLWHAAGAVAAYPHYIARFNEIARYSGGGAKYLGDSNLDWGQDLSLAARKLKELGAEGAILCYFGTASPFAEEFTWQVLPPAQRAKRLDPWVVLPAEGPQWLVMSATNLQGVYYRAPGGGPPYPWLDGVEPDHVLGDGAMGLYEISKNEVVQKGLAEMYFRHGLGEEGEAALRRAIARIAFDLDSRRQLLERLLARGEAEEALALIQEAPNPDVAMLLRGVSLLKQMARFEEAHRSMRQAFKAFPNDPEMKNAIAWHLVERGEDLVRAEELATEAVEWSPDDPYFLDTRGMVRRALGDLSGALEDLEHALTLPGGDLAEIEWHRAQLLVDLGDIDAAIDAMDEILMRTDVSEDLRIEIELWREELSGLR